ncbi:MAG: TRAP transporter substrate-binding protein DctP [Gammaproteobacteria bacterium]|nr:TRAP transporter substrate-binding protein DctP [Gammaproteobacteria bacterium]
MRAAIFTLCLLAGCGGTADIDSGVIELVYASPYSPNHPFSLADRDWMAFVEREAAGRLRIRPSWSGALLSSDQSMIELRHGVADIGLITPIYAKGGAHLLRTQTGFYSGVRTVGNQVALYRCMAEQSPEFAAELAGLEVLAVQGGNLPGLLTRNTPVHSLADMEGLRIRAPTELLPVLREFGVDPVSMPMGEVYSALAKGIIDGVIAPTDTFLSLHFAEVAHYYAEFEVPRGAYPARAMGTRKWNSLPGDIRDVLLRGVPVWEQALAERTLAAVTTGAEYGRAQGITLTAIPPEDQRRFAETYERYARRTAEALDAYGIDGLSVYQAAKASITDTGTVECRRAP